MASSCRCADGPRARPGLRAWIAAVAALAAGACGAQSLVLSGTSDRHSDPVALSRLDDQHAPLEPRSGRNLIYLRDELRLALQMPGAAEGGAGGSTWSVLWRQAATLTASSGALRLKNRIDADVPGQPGERFGVDLRYDGFSGWGVAWQYASRPQAGWRWGVSAQALRLRKLQRVTLDGSAQAVAGSVLGYEFDLHASRAQDGLDFDYQQAYPSQGLGLIAGAELGWCGLSVCAGVQLEDLGWLHWKKLPAQTAELQATGDSYDADGYLEVTPLIQGRNRQDGRTRTTPRSWTSYLQWQAAPAWRLDAALQTLGGFGPLPRVGASWRATDGLELGLQWRIHERRLSVQATGDWWQVGLGADRLDGHARSLGVSIRAVAPLP